MRAIGVEFRDQDLMIRRARCDGIPRPYVITSSHVTDAQRDAPRTAGCLAICV
jgi:hypothetical protein